MPTQAPPQAPQVPDFSNIPFASALDPRLAQQGVQQQIEQAQSQGPQFNGYEGKTGAIAGMLTKFLEGASVGRARADAKALHDQSMSATTDAQQLQHYIDQAGNSDKDPDAIQGAQSKYLDMMGKWAVRDIGEAAKTNPLMKGLHTVAQTLMGGPPADEGTRKDPKTGKTMKTKSGYQSGMNAEEIIKIQKELAAAPSKSEKAASVATDLTGKAQKIANELARVNGVKPEDLTSDQLSRAMQPLIAEANSKAQRYGMLSNPVQGFIDSYRRAPTYGEEREINKDKLFDNTFGGQQQQTKTQPPPSSPNSQFYVGGIQNGQAPQQQQAPQQAAPAAQTPENYTPETLYKLYQDKKIDREDVFVTDAPGSSNGKEVRAYFTPKGYVTEDGKPIPMDRVASKSAREGAAWSEKEDQDPKYGHVTYLFNNRTGESKIATVKNEDGEEVPRRRYYAGTDPQTRLNKIQDKLSDRFFVIENDRKNKLEALDKEATQKDSNGDPRLTQEQYTARRKAIVDSSKELMDHVTTRATNIGAMLQSAEDRKVAPLEPKTSSLATKNNSPFNLNNGQDYIAFKDPKEGVKAGLDLMDKYMSDKGMLNVNGNSTLYDMMKQWAPKGHGDNDPEAYAEVIAKELNLPNGIATQIKDLRGKKYEIAKAMFTVEGSKGMLPVLDEVMGKKSAKTTTEPPNASKAGKPEVVSFDDFMK